MTRKILLKGFNLTFFIGIFIVSACQTGPKAVPKASLNDLLKGETIEEVDRAKIVQAAHDRANKELNAGNPKAAIHFAEIAQRFDPEDINTSILLGRAFIAQGDYEAALAEFKTVNSKEKSPVTLEYQGLSEYFTHRFEASKSNLELAYKLDSSLWQSAAILGRLYRADGDITKSETMFSNAFTQAPDAAPVHDHKGYAFLSDRNWGEAVNAFEQAQALSNRSIGFHDAYRVAKAKSGDLAGALSLASDFQSAQLYLDLAKLAIEDGERVEAVRLLRRAKAASPQHNTEIEQLLTAAKAMKS